MRRLFAPLVLGIALAGAPALSPAFAQPPAGQPDDRGPGFDVEARLSELRTRLSLTDAQVTQVRAILEDARTRMMALRDAPPPADRSQHPRREILFQVEDRIWALLTCPQKDQFRLYQRERMMEHMEHRHGGGRGPHGGHRPHGGRHHGGPDR